MKKEVKNQTINFETKGLDEVLSKIDKNVNTISKSSKPRKLKVKTYELKDTGQIHFTKDEHYKIPLEFILLPFFTRSKERLINLEYKFVELGLEMYSTLPSRDIEGSTIKQPSSLEEKLLEFIITQYHEQINNNIDEKFITFELKDFIENYLQNKMSTAYYTFISEALKNLKHTIYSFSIRNKNKCGNFGFESENFSLIDYEKITKNKKVYYRIKLHENIKLKVKQKRFIILKKEARNEIDKKDSIALRIYQYLSMIRFGKNSGEVRLELLAAIIPLSTVKFEKVKKNGEFVKLKDGSFKYYKKIKRKAVKKRIENAFKVLVDLKYIKEFETIERVEDKSFNFSYIFGEKEGLISSYLKKNKRNLLENKEEEIVNNSTLNFLKETIDYTKRNIYFSKKWNGHGYNRIMKMVKEEGQEWTINVLNWIYKNLKNEIKQKSLSGYLTWASNFLKENTNEMEKTKNIKSSIIKNNDIIDAEIVEEEKVNDIFKEVEEKYKNLSSDKKNQVEKQAYSQFLKESDIKDNKTSKRIFTGNIKIKYILKYMKGLEELVG